MRFKNLTGLKNEEKEYITLGALPQQIRMTDYAKQKAYKVNELVKEIHGGSYEWYGYLIGKMENPEVVIDIGIGKNDQNQFAYTRIDSGEIEKFNEALSLDKVINGWIHSHGDLGFRQFSGTDDNNHITVLDYVTSLLKKPIGKKEVPVSNLSLLVKGKYETSDLEKGSVSIITDIPITDAKIMETIYGGFAYAVVIGDEGWHEQEIFYKKQALLSGTEKMTKIGKAEIIPVETGRILTLEDIEELRNEVKEKIDPGVHYSFMDYTSGVFKRILPSLTPDKSYPYSRRYSRFFGKKPGIKQGAKTQGAKKGKKGKKKNFRVIDKRFKSEMFKGDRDE